MKAYNCVSCGGILRQGMAITAVKNARYHTHCWWKLKEKEIEAKTKQSGNTELPTKK